MLYKAYHKQIVDNAVAYIAKKYQDACGEPINQMKMYKILALFDFRCVKDFGSPCTELTYLALQKGPVPNELYNGDESIYEHFTSKKFDVNGNTYKYYVCTAEPDTDYFSRRELNLLDSIIKYFIDNKLSSDDAAELTHKEIAAWRKAWEKKPNSIIKYSDEFDGIYDKKEDELTRQEDRFLVYSWGANA